MPACLACFGVRAFLVLLSIGLTSLVFPANNYAHLDRQAGKITEVRHFRIGGVPKFRFDRLKLREDGSAVGIVRRDPINGLKIRSVIGVLLGVVTIDRFSQSRGCESGLLGACFIVAELV